MFSKEFIDHYMHPRNWGRLIFYTKKIEIKGTAPHFDKITAYVKLNGRTIIKIKYKTKGSTATTAAMSYLSEKVIGQNVEDLLEDIKPQQIVDDLKLEPQQKYAAELAHQVLEKL